LSRALRSHRDAPPILRWFTVILPSGTASTTRGSRMRLKRACCAAKPTSLCTHTSCRLRSMSHNTQPTSLSGGLTVSRRRYMRRPTVAQLALRHTMLQTLRAGIRRTELAASDPAQLRKVRVSWFGTKREAVMGECAMTHVQPQTPPLSGLDGLGVSAGVDVATGADQQPLAAPGGRGPVAAIEPTAEWRADGGPGARRVCCDPGRGVGATSRR
jgi:hypothetical protein